MIIKVDKSIAKGTIKAPPSKSYAHRYLIASFLAGKGEIDNIELSDDILATLSCLESLGLTYEYNDNKITLNNSRDKNNVFDAKESGSTLRFLIPLILLNEGKYRIFASKRLFLRGLSVYEDIFAHQKISYKYEGDYLEITGKLKPDLFIIDATISSQFITGLLFALPLLDKDSEIICIGSISSEPYVDITLDVLKEFGVVINRTETGFKVPGNQRYKKKKVTVEGDYSNAAFLDALNLLGGEVNISNLNPASKQGDKVYKDYFKLLKEGTPTISLDNAIDLGPILFTVASIFNGATFKEISRLRIKESDRVKDMLDILSKFGVRYIEEDNELTIFKSDLIEYKDIIYPQKDHRLIMSTIVLLTLLGGKIANTEAINKSYPSFLKDIKSLGVKYEIIEE